MVAPLPINLQISAQVTFPLETGLFKEPHATFIVRNTGCLDTVQLKTRKDVGYNQLKCGEHMTLAGVALTHPVSDHAALRGTPPDIADRQAAEQCHLFLQEDEERNGLAGIIFLLSADDARPVGALGQLVMPPCRL